MGKQFTFINLTKGEVATIDTEDFLFLNQWKWHYRKGYANRREYLNDGKGSFRDIYMHRLVNKTPNGMFTDHINGNKLDNRKSNLRDATSSQNKMNIRIRGDNTSGVRGVWFDKTRNKWAVEIMVSKKKIHLGRFSDKIDAISIRRLAEKKYFGEFSYEGIG